MGKRLALGHPFTNVRGLKLVIVHNHFRPGGVRRVIELAAPHLVNATTPPIDGVVLLGGEAPDASWLRLFQRQLGNVPVVCETEAALGYISEQRAKPVAIIRRIRAQVERCLDQSSNEESCVVWAHNQGLGRNLLLTRELERICAAREVPLIFHHHDWWFDNRWARWPEMRRAGFRTLADVAHAIFSTDKNVRHAAINRADAAILQRHLGQHASWLPNLAEKAPAPPPPRVKHARRWLRDALGDDAPVWLVPCRLLRRKNLLEALLLTRWLRPAAWLVTTGGVSSADERAHADALAAAARHHGWRLRLSVLAGDESKKPTVDELLSASESILLTSLQEGFGLPNLEAASAGRPLIVRALANIAPDLAQFGFEFPQSYDEVRIDPRLYDWQAEMKRQESRWRTWRSQLPRVCRSLAGRPPWLILGAPPKPVPFSRLTMVAQLEVLARDVHESWDHCAPLNPFLQPWRDRASEGTLEVSRWPGTAKRWLSGSAYARGFSDLLNDATGSPPPAGASAAVAQQFIRAKLTGTNQYPLLWTREP